MNACLNGSAIDYASALQVARSLVAPNQVARNVALAPPSRETLEKIETVHQACLQVADVEIATDHIIHGGMYARTIKLPLGVVMVGATIKRATLLIIHGSVSMTAGDASSIDLDGYNVLTGSVGRKSVFVARGPVSMTMLFATDATTVEEAEDQVFADDVDALMSRKDVSRDTFTITGE